MTFDLHKYAVLRDGAVVRFQSVTDITKDEVLVPVVADPYPPLGRDQKFGGPDYEVFADYVRAYFKAVPMEPEEIAARNAILPQIITRRQAATQLRNNQFITQAEALAMASMAVIPPFVQSYFNTLDPTDKADAELEFTAIEYPRSSSLLTAVMETNGLTSEQIDQFFISAAKL